MAETAVANTSQNPLVLYRPEDLQPQAMFKAIKTLIPVVPSDFHSQPINGQMMPKQHHVNRIADAAGITFETVDKVKDDTSWTVTVRAFKRGPDGTMRSADGSYNYDWVERAKDGGKRVALQRAETGARLRAIRAVVGIPTAFDRDNFDRALEVCRIVVDTGSLLADPNMRTAAINHALGAKDSLYGPGERDVTPEREQIEAPAEKPQATASDDPDADDFDLDATDDEPIGEDKARVWKALEEYEAAFKLPPKTTAHIATFRADLQAADIDAMRRLLDWLKGWEERNPEARR